MPTDRLCLSGFAPSSAPLVTREHDGRRLVIAAANAAAAALGLTPGTALAHAQAMVPGLHIADADRPGDGAALARLAGDCLRLCPLTAPDGDGVWLDVTGSTHLHGGEHAMVAALVRHMADNGLAARAAMAGTPGAAHAMARHGGQAVIVVPPEDTAAALAPLPVACLRLQPGTVATLRRLGLDTVGQLAALPRGPLARRMGAMVLQRLDQALGRVAEPITPVVPPGLPSARASFAEPLLTAESLVAVIAHLTAQLCTGLEKSGRGVRQLDLLFERVDGTVQAIRIGTAQPSRNARHLARLLDEQVERVDPGLGVDAMQLVAPLVEGLSYTQSDSLAADGDADMASLVDRLSNRLGCSRVWRASVRETAVPERSAARVGAVVPPTGQDWPSWPRPARLLSPPQPVQMTSGLPDYPPAAFTWHRHRHRVRRADGPERVNGEWWQRDGECGAVRDYWHVEDDTGRRFWLYRRGDGVDMSSGDMQWFMHGVF